MIKLHQGDRYMIDHGENTVVTPRSSDNPHNFGPASFRDSFIYTCGRPGGDLILESGRKIPTSEVVSEWVQFMTSPGREIRHVFILLTDDELEVYEEPGLIATYQSHGIKVHHIPYASRKSFQKIMSELEIVKNQQQDGALTGNAAVHCTHGMGRSGRVAAGWLVHKYGLSVEEAVEEALDAARKAGAERMGSPLQLAEWMAE
eukprot:CCRYP_019002-RA/>CCRYP_019002-RA protein AED:0.27 eAED:0.27 QI:0/-1/0/1/-1/1/1/0/202